MSQSTPSNRRAHVDGPVVLCGGSNGTAFFSGLWSSGKLPAGALDVRVVSRRPERFSKPLTCRETHTTGEGFMLGDSVFAPKKVREFQSGPVKSYSYDDIEVAVRDACCLWISAPVFAYQDILSKVVPAVIKEAERAGRTEENPFLITVMYAQGGVDWIAIKEAGGRLPKGVGLCLLKNFPCLVSRLSEDVVENFGYNPNLGWFVPVPKTAGPSAERMVRALYGGAVTNRSWTIKELDTPLLCTMGGSNQLLHPTIIGGLLGPPPGRTFQEQPKVYRNLPWKSYQLMAAVWKEYCHLTLALEKTIGVKMMDDFGFVGPVRLLISLYGHYWPNFLVEGLVWIAINGTTRLRAAKMPLVHDPHQPQDTKEKEKFVLNTQHRFIVDDVPYGLCIAFGMAEIIGFEMPAVADLIVQLQQYLNKEYLVVKGAKFVLAGRDVAETGAPQAYNVRTVGQLKSMVVHGELPHAVAKL